MKPIKYKQHKIRKTDTKISAGGRLRSLFVITGILSKDATEKPYILTLEAAKKYINQSIEQWIENNDSDEYKYIYHYHLYRYRNDGQFRTPSNLYLAGSTSYCERVSFHDEMIRNDRKYNNCISAMNY